MKLFLIPLNEIKTITLNNNFSREISKLNDNEIKINLKYFFLLA